MKTLEQLLALKAEKITAMKAIRDGANARGEGKSDITDDEFKKLEALNGEVVALNDEIKVAEARESVLASVDSEIKSGLEVVRHTVSSGRIQAQRDLVRDDPMCGFKSSQEFFRAVVDFHTSGGKIPENAPQLALLIPKADGHSVSDNARGGVLVPTALAPDLKMIGSEGNPLTSMTTKVEMGAGKIKIPTRVDKDQSGGSVTGGLKFYRNGEQVEAIASRTKFGAVDMEAFELVGAAYATSKLLRDSPQSVASLLQASFAEEYNNKILDEMIRGTGVGEYEGVLNSPSLVTVAKETGQGAATIEVQNIYNMRSRIFGYANSVWVANPDTLPQLLALKDGDFKLWQPSLREDAPETLMGRPLLLLDAASTVGAVGDIMLLNMSQYLEGLHVPFTGQSSIHVRFLSREETFLFYAENCGKSWWKAPLTPKNSTITRSPFVTLALRA